MTFSASGGVAPYTFKVAAGALPKGMTLSPSGKLSGKPVAAGKFTFTVRATDSNGYTGSRACSLSVSATAASAY